MRRNIKFIFSGRRSRGTDEKKPAWRGGRAAFGGDLLRHRPVGLLRRADALARLNADINLFGLCFRASQRVGEDLVERSSICHGATLYAAPEGAI